MQELIIRDVRLLGGKPRGNEDLEVDGTYGPTGAVVKSEVGARVAASCPLR